LRAKFDAAAADPSSTSAVEAALLKERLDRYPVDGAQVAPSQFGNAIRAFETYGYDRYCLDSQTLWNELIGFVPEAVRQEEADARTPVNFFVSAVWLDVVYVATVFITIFSKGLDGGLAASLLLGLVIAPALYLGAVRSCAGWGQAVRAVVNLGRRPLADALGVCIPRTIAQEREMWQVLGWFVAERYEPASAAELNRWRVSPNARHAPRRSQKLGHQEPDSALAP
jgi:hypothetical protein